MDYNTSDYFTYKRNKQQNEAPRQKKPISKLNFLFQLFVATFIIIFILIALSIMKYSTKIDIEYSRNDLAELDSNGTIPSYTNIQDTEQKRIDKRLSLIQQEENAPSEAKIITDYKHNNIVIDPKLVEENKKIDKKHQQELKQRQKQRQEQELLKKQSEETANSKVIEVPKPTIANAISEITQKPQNQPIQTQESNITIMSKVLIGRYSNFEEAQAMQNTIKAQNPSLAPYVKKVGNVFSIQMGSYQDFNIAKRYAQTLQAKGYDVWIYQQ